MSPTTPRNLTMKTCGLGGSRVPEPVVTGVMCPKCLACNAAEGQHHVWRAVDERGFHWECDVCSTAWGFR
jgi:hypothetical protein